MRWAFFPGVVVKYYVDSQSLGTQTRPFSFLFWGQWGSGGRRPNLHVSNRRMTRNSFRELCSSPISLSRWRTWWWWVLTPTTTLPVAVAPLEASLPAPTTPSPGWAVRACVFHACEYVSVMPLVKDQVLKWFFFKLTYEQSAYQTLFKML